MQLNDQIHPMRGARVDTLNLEDIEIRAKKAAKALKINKDTLENMAYFMEFTLGEYGILVDPISDEDWIPITNAMCQGGTICMPDSLYHRICSKDPEAIFILFHELGHLLLGHKAVLHHSTTLPTKFEDSEWQADKFSESILQFLKVKYEPSQFSLRF